MKVRSGTKITDNVIVTLTDSITGKERAFSAHNLALNYANSAFAQWIGGKNNLGYQPLSPPTQIELGYGEGVLDVSDPGLFISLQGTLFSFSYKQLNSPVLGTTTFIFQIPAGIVSTLVTEALFRDTSANPWFHTMFPVPFTPLITENITIQWSITFSA